MAKTFENIRELSMQFTYVDLDVLNTYLGELSNYETLLTINCVATGVSNHLMSYFNNTIQLDLDTEDFEPLYKMMSLVLDYEYDSVEFTIPHPHIDIYIDEDELLFELAL